MGKTRMQEVDTKIQDFRLERIDLEGRIDALTPKTIPDHIQYNRDRDTRDKELALLRGSLEAVDRKIAILTAEKLALAGKLVSTAAKNKPKKVRVYSKIEAMLRRTPLTAKTELFKKLAEEWDDSVDSIRKAYYDEQKKQISQRIAKSGAKGASKPQSKQSNQGKTKSPAKSRDSDET